MKRNSFCKTHAIEIEVSNYVARPFSVAIQSPNGSTSRCFSMPDFMLFIIGAKHLNIDGSPDGRLLECCPGTSPDGIKNIQVILKDGRKQIIFRVNTCDVAELIEVQI